MPVLTVPACLWLQEFHTEQESCSPTRITLNIYTHHHLCEGWGMHWDFSVLWAKAKCCRKHGQAALPASSLPTQHRSPDCRQHTPQVISLCPPCQPQFVFAMPRGCERGGDAAEAIPRCSEGWPLLLGALPLLLTWGVGHASARLSVKLQRRLQVIWMVCDEHQQARLLVINSS